MIFPHTVILYFATHSSIDGLLGCLHFWALIMTITAMKIQIPVLLWMYVLNSFDYRHLVVLIKLLCHMITLCLSFWETAKLFFKLPVPFYNPTSKRVWLHVFWLFDSSHSWWVWGGILLWFWFVFLGWEDPLEKGQATHSSILAWRIPRAEEPGELQSMGS